MSQNNSKKNTPHTQIITKKQNYEHAKIIKKHALAYDLCEI